MRQLVLDVRPPHLPDLQNFIVGANQALLEALIAQAQGNGARSLLLWGAPGCGRSYLLQACTHFANSLMRRAQFISAHSHEPILPNLQLLAIDDLEQANENLQADLFRHFVSAETQQCSLLFAAAGPPQSLKLREDLRSRIAQADVFELQPLSDSEKAATLRQHANALGMEMNDAVIDYLLHHGKRDLPWLLAVIDALDEASLANKRAVTVPLLKSLL